ncbi:MAG: sigma-70 family RNA polymerase sigma factor [Planctomycetia bacterium]|nr:sigma-70 family RNA polymerase sigma factor [Planctomycetia bacterium]
MTGAGRLDERPTGAVASERDVIDAAKRGQAAAFETLVRRHELAVYSYFRPRLTEPADADDLCQEVFLRTYQNLAKFNHSVPLRAWLLGIARNVLREYVRATRRSRAVTWTELCLNVEHAAPETGGGETSGVYDEILPHLPNCMSSLGESARASLQMHYDGRCKIAQIAERMHRSSDAVRLLMYRARKALKRCLDRKLTDADE